MVLHAEEKNKQKKPQLNPYTQGLKKSARQRITSNRTYIETRSVTYSGKRNTEGLGRRLQGT